MRRVRELKDRGPGHVLGVSDESQNYCFVPISHLSGQKWNIRPETLAASLKPDTRDVLSRRRAARQHTPLVAVSPATSRQDTNPVKSLFGLHLDPTQMVNCAQTSETHQINKEIALTLALQGSRGPRWNMKTSTKDKLKGTSTRHDRRNYDRLDDETKVALANSQDAWKQLLASLSSKPSPTEIPRDKLFRSLTC